MTAKNDITGDKIKTKPATDEYRKNYEKIFTKPPQKNKEKVVKGCN